jgi:hypothetical protein
MAEDAELIPRAAMFLGAFAAAPLIDLVLMFSKDLAKLGEGDP